MKSSIGIFYQITVTDKKGKVVRKTRLRRSRSFVLQFLQFLSVAMKGASVSIKDITSAMKTVTPHSDDLEVHASIGDVALGIVLGTGTTPADDTDYVLETLIAHGSAATQINYAGMSYIEAQVVGANVDFQASRTFQNLSGSTINVTEAGIYANGYATGDFSFLIVHDIFSAVAVANGQTITVTYTLRTTV